MTDTDKYSDEDWENILYDTWYHNDYYELMCSILYKKYPLERHECHADCWWEEKTFTAEEMRETLRRVEVYWKDKVNMLLSEREELK